MTATLQDVLPHNRCGYVRCEGCTGWRCKTAQQCRDCYEATLPAAPAWDPAVRSRDRDEQRERTAQLTRAGWSAAAIARDLGVTERSVCRYRRQLRLIEQALAGLS